MPLRLVGTRSRAIRHRTSEEGEHLAKLMGKSLISDSARARSLKQRKRSVETIQRRTRGSASRAGEVARSYHSYGAYQRFNSSQKQRPSGRVLFLERFLDRSAGSIFANLTALS